MRKSGVVGLSGSKSGVVRSSRRSAAGSSSAAAADRNICSLSVLKLDVSEGHCLFVAPENEMIPFFPFFNENIHDIHAISF
jgi:hypothetical protein